MQSQPVIAVTGAGGRVGGLVARRLSTAGARQRLLGRNPMRLPELPGAVSAPGASYGDGEAVRRAVNGAHTLFLVSAHEGPDRVRDHYTVVDAAITAGVERIVYLSYVGASPGATFTFARDHWHTEQHIRGAGVRFTFLRDNHYMSEIAHMVGDDGVLRGPAGKGRIAAVAHEDVAHSAAAVLLDESGHDGRTYDLTGPEAFTFAEAADELSHFCGRPVDYVPETRAEAYASRERFGAPEWEVTGWVTSYEAIAAGEMAAVSDAVPRLTGGRARTLREFLRDHPENYARLMAER
ncbi:SDR family oxidoreductase [Streptomyces sp. NPDC002004]